MVADPVIYEANIPPCPRKADGSLDIWVIWTGIRSPIARRYLENIAAAPKMSVRAAVNAAGSRSGNSVLTSQSHHQWRVTYPGFAALDDELRMNPRTAARFLSELYLPAAIAASAKILQDPNATLEQKERAGRQILTAARGGNNKTVTTRMSDRKRLPPDIREKYLRRSE